MQAGKLQHRVRIEKKEYTQDQTTGEMKHTWQLHKKLWVDFNLSSARQLIAAQSMQSKVVGEVKARYRTDIDSTMRIVHRGKYYNIEGVIPDNKSGLEHITMPVSEGVNEGYLERYQDGLPLNDKGDEVLLSVSMEK